MLDTVVATIGGRPVRRRVSILPGRKRAERKLELKARIHELLAGSDAGLSDAEISSKLSESNAELQRALYEMLREETIVFTTERKYRVKTVA